MLKLNSRGSSNFLSNPVVLIALMVLVGVGAIFGYRYYLQYTGNTALSNVGSSTLAEDQVKKLLENVSSHIVLPEDEKPIVASVTDIEKLSDQDFFKSAQNGDRVIIYTQAKIAILYREEIDRVVNMAPFTGEPIAGIDGTQGDSETGIVEEEQSENTDQETAETPVEVDLVRLVFYNGTSVAGITSSINLQEDFDDIDFSIVDRANAEGEYSDTLVVDLTGESSDIAGRVASLVNGTVGELPEGEEAPDADILVIVGSSFLDQLQ